jgi:hypothetical protein
MEKAPSKTESLFVKGEGRRDIVYIQNHVTERDGWRIHGFFLGLHGFAAKEAQISSLPLRAKM